MFIIFYYKFNLDKFLFEADNQIEEEFKEIISNNFKEYLPILKLKDKFENYKDKDFLKILINDILTDVIILGDMSIKENRYTKIFNISAYMGSIEEHLSNNFWVERNTFCISKNTIEFINYKKGNKNNSDIVAVYKEIFNQEPRIGARVHKNNGVYTELVNAIMEKTNSFYDRGKLVIEINDGNLPLDENYKERVYKIEMEIKDIDKIKSFFKPISEKEYKVYIIKKEFK